MRPGIWLMGYMPSYQKVSHWIENYVELFNDSDRELVKKFIQEAKAYNLTDSSIWHYIEKLKNIRFKYIRKDFSEWNKEDVKSLLVKVNQVDYSEWTRHGYKNTIRKFFQIIGGHEWMSKRYPPIVGWIKLNPRIKKDYQILTKEDIERMIEVANQRDKAILSVFWGGLRLEEMWQLKVSDVHFDEHGCVVFCSGKTGQRPVRLCHYWEHLKEYLEFREEFLKDRKKRMKWLWITLDTFTKGRCRLSAKAIRIMLKRIGKRTGITKPVHPHNFRHSSATYYSRFLTDIEMRIRYGWSRNSTMPSLYSHLSSRDVDDKLVRLFCNNNSHIMTHEVREEYRPSYIG